MVAMKRLFCIVMAFCVSVPVLAQRPAPALQPRVRHVEPLTQETQLQLRGILGLSIHEPLNEAAVIQIIRDKQNPGLRGIAAQLAPALPKTPAITQALWDLLADATVTTDVGIRETLTMTAVSALAQFGETGWEDGVVAELPTMTEDRIAQLYIAQTLVSVGRAEGWPIVKAAIADPKPFFVTEGLRYAVYFDQLPNPDGGKPIDVVAELRQLASTASEQFRSQIQGEAARVAQVDRRQR